MKYYGFCLILEFVFGITAEDEKFLIGVYGF